MQQQPLKKQSSKNSSLMSKNLKVRAQIMEIDAKLKTAEDELVRQRKEQKQEMRMLRNYLKDMKSGSKVKREDYYRSTGTKVVSN